MEEDKKDEITPTQEGVLREQIEHDEAIFQENDGEMLRQHEEEEALRLRKLQEEVASHSPQQEITPTLPEGSNQLAQEEQLERFRIFEAIQKLARDNANLNEMILETQTGSDFDTKDLAKILEGKPFLSVKDVLRGDTLVITTTSGSNFYFRINQGIDADNKYAKGDLRRVTKDGEVKDYADVIFDGTTLGNSVTPGKLFVDGVPAQFRLPKDIDSMSLQEKAQLIERDGPKALLPRLIITSPLTGAQIIKAETIENQSPSSS